MLWLLIVVIAAQVFVGLAFWLALFGRAGSRFLYFLLGILFWIVPAGGACAALAFSVVMVNKGLSTNYVPQATLLVLATLIGGRVALVRGGMRCEWGGRVCGRGGGRFGDCCCWRS